jgi:hypothetical protein
MGIRRPPRIRAADPTPGNSGSSSEVDGVADRLRVLWVA